MQPIPSVAVTNTATMYAQDVCNQIAQSYIEYDLTKKAISSVKIVEFIVLRKIVILMSD